MRDMINPYIAGAPVTEARMFFGREDVFEWIERSLTGRYADHILVIHGQRRVGKTSVLKQLANRLPSMCAALNGAGGHSLVPRPAGSGDWADHMTAHLIVQRGILGQWVEVAGVPAIITWTSTC